MRRSFLFAVLLSAAVAHADQVTLKNGDRLTGSIQKSDADAVTLKTDYADTVTIKWSAIDHISGDQQLYVTSKQGQVLVGTVESSDDKFKVRTEESGEISLTRDAVQVIRSPEEQKLAQAWSGFVDTGLSLTRGNSETLNYNLGASADRTTERDKVSVYAVSLFAKSTIAGVTTDTAKAVRGGLRYDFNLGKQAFAFAFTDLEYDKFQQLDLRNVLGGGFGYHFIKTDTTMLDLFAGASFNQEFFSNDITRRSAEVLVGNELSYELSGNVVFKERLAIYPNVSDLGAYRGQFDTSLLTKLNNWLGWQITLSDRYLSDPLPGIKKNDLLMTTGLRLTFGRESTNK
jgi:putative salt-induced outer membrane protein YdiY